MEKTNPGKPHDTFSESAKHTNNWHNETATKVMELYQSQLTQAYSFYADFFNSFFSQPANNFANFSSKGKEQFNFFSPFGGPGAHDGFPNPFLSVIEKTLKQMNEYNRGLFDTIGRQMGGSINWDSLNKKYQKNIEINIEASKKILAAVMEANSKKMEFTFETNKHLQENINEQVKAVIEQNQHLWSDIFSAVQNNHRSEESHANHPGGNHSKHDGGGHPNKKPNKSGVLA